MERSSDPVFELFLDEDSEATPNAEDDSNSCKYSIDEYKEETEPAFLFKGAYAQSSDNNEEDPTGNSQAIEEYTNNQQEYESPYGYNSYGEKDAPVKTQSRPKIADRIKTFEQLANSNSSSPQINRYVNDNYDPIEHNNKEDPPELQRQESSSSIYITNDEASHDSYGDVYQDKEQSDKIPSRAVSAPLIHQNSRDWNVEFQTLISLPTQSTLERLDRAKQIQIFVQEFTSEVSRIGKVIINEVGKSIINKTYPPVNVGGIAGGEKYLVNNIFFKFALDIYHLYGGTEFAMKAANMELLGLDAYLDAQKVVHGLRIPLMCLLDYKGYRLAATTVLPIDKDTLIYGSADGGKTVMMSNPLVNKAMEDAAKHLNIKPHRVTDNLVTIHSPIDIEVHAAHDNNYYVLDTARVWPPEHPVSFLPAMLLPAKGDNIEKFDLEISKLSVMLGQSLEKASSVLSEGVVYFGDQKELENEQMNEFASIIAGFPIKGKAVFIYGFQGRFLYNQLRPEFVKKYLKPLSSDAFSGFGKHDAKENNAEIIEATRYLRDNVIRTFSDKLLKGELVVSSGSGLIDAMHQHGVNVRYLGLLLNCCADDSRLAGVIMTEMVARTLKNFMKRKLRMMKTREDGHCQKIIVKYLNIALGNSPHSELFWNKLIYLLMEMKFGQYLTSKINQKLKNPLRVYISNVPLLFGLLKHIGVKLSEEIHKQIIYDKKFLETKEPFKVDDILSIDSSLKGLKFGSPKEFNQLIDQHVKFLLNDVPQQNTVEYLLQSKKEKQKVVKNFYGNNHVECALSVTELASFYVNENRLEEAKSHLVLANELLYIIREVPVEAFLSLMLSFGMVEEKLGNTQKALDYYLIGLGLIDRLFSPAAKGAGGLMFHALIVNQTHHPMLLFFLNNCIKYLKDHSKTVVDLKDLAAAYFNTWKTLEFPGDSDARSRLFGADYPYAMSLVWEEHMNASSMNINQQLAFKLLHAELGDKPLSDPVTQQWLNKVLLNDNQTGVTIYVNMEADDLLKLKFPVPRLFVPDQVALGTTLKFSWEGIDIAKRPYKIRLLSTSDDNYVHEVSKLIEVETYAVPSVTGEMSIPPTKLAKPGQYYLDVADGSFTTNLRLFGFLVTAPDTPPIDNFSIELSSRKLAIEYKLLGREINGAAIGGRGGLLLTDGEDPIFLRSGDEGVSAVLKGKDFVSIKSTHFELFRSGYTFVEIFSFIGLTKNRQLYTWGYGKNYANGHGSEDTLTVPRAVASLTGVKIFDACGGTNFMAALTIKGEVLLSGTIPWSDQVLKTFTPLDLPNKERVVSICASAYGLCLLTEKGYALYYGETYEDAKNPKCVTGIKLTFKNEKIIDIAAGSNHHLFVSESGKIAGLGMNSNGSLGYGHAETMKFLTEDTELTPANQCPGVKFVRVFANRSVSAAIDDQGRFYYWGSALFLPRSPTALAQYNIKSVHFLPTHIIVSTNPSAPYKLQLEPLAEVHLVPIEANNNNINVDIKQMMNQARDQTLVEFFGTNVKEFLTKCSLTAEQVTKAETALINAGIIYDSLPLLTKSSLSRIIDDELTVLKIVQHVTAYYLKTISNVNN